MFQSARVHSREGTANRLRQLGCHLLAGGWALERAEVESEYRGSHVFRHSLATGMLNHGASLDEIGDLLRHRRPDTTRIYAKVDLVSLRSIALPWPGGSR